MSANEIAGLGAITTFMVLMFIFMAVIGGWRMALLVVGIAVGLMAMTAGIVLFWFWIAGVFA